MPFHLSTRFAGPPALCCALALATAPALTAQNQTAVTAVTGVVTGPNGVPLGDAVVSAHSSRSGATRVTKSNDTGKFTLVFTDSSGTLQVTVKASGYVPWTGDVSRKIGENRISLNVTLQPGGTAADWPPTAAPSPALVLARSQLGAADAISVTVDVGDILVRGTNTDRIVYKTYPKVAPPTSADSPPPPGEIAPRGTHEIGPQGLTIVSGGGVVLQIDVPRTLKSLALKITQQGLVTVSNFDGELSVLNAAGPVRMGGVSGPSLVEARNGDISATIATIPAAMNFLGRNGTVTLTIPTDARASFSAEVHRGTITLDSTSRIVFPPSGFLDLATIDDHRVDVPAPDQMSKLPWIVGGGGAAITITNLNGNIVIRRTPPKAP